MAEPADEVLLAGLDQGREDAIAALYDRFAVSLYRFARVLLGSPEGAEDAVQDVFLGLIRARKTGAPIQNIRAYLFASLRHNAAQRVRRRKLEPMESLEKIEQAAKKVSPDSKTEMHFALDEALQKLPFEQREIISLKIDGELTFAEAAQVLKISPNTAASRYRYALEKLREELRE